MKQGQLWPQLLTPRPIKIQEEEWNNLLNKDMGLMWDSPLYAINIIG